MKTAVIDMDGVICDERPTFERSLASPIQGARELLLRLHDEGWTIIIHTARSWSEYAMTKRWLFDHDIVFNELIMGKPLATILVDDRAVTSLEQAVDAALGAK
jgi:phosphoglycolate phosphatase-like HAD superfamily hydrolase